MIYKRYFISEIAGAAAAVFSIIAIIFTGDCAVDFMADAVSQSLPPATVGLLILLRLAIAMEVILPATFFFAVIVALGRLHKDLEMTAFSACGLGLPQVLKLIFVLSLPVAVLSAYASLYVRPLAWEKIYHLLDEAQYQFDISRLNPGTFLEIQSGKAVFFADKVQDNGRSAKEVFVRITDGEKRKVIRARRMTQSEDANGQRVLIFEDGTIHELPSQGEAKLVHFRKAQYDLPEDNPGGARYRRKATATAQLVGSSRLEDMAELQWRLSAPLSTILLAILGIPLSRSNFHKRSRLPGIGFAIAIFAFYFQLFVIARTWVDKAVVFPLIGIWWVPSLLIALTFILLQKTGELFCRQAN